MIGIEAEFCKVNVSVSPLSGSVTSSCPICPTNSVVVSNSAPSKIGASFSSSTVMLIKVDSERLTPSLTDTNNSYCALASWSIVACSVTDKTPVTGSIENTLLSLPESIRQSEIALEPSLSLACSIAIVIPEEFSGTTKFSDCTTGR